MRKLDKNTLIILIKLMMLVVLLAIIPESSKTINNEINTIQLSNSNTTQIVSSDVAMVGNDTYTNFIDAWNAANNNVGSTLTLLSNVNTESRLDTISGADFTLDLNNYTIDRGLSATTEDGSVIFVIHGSSLIIDDSSNEGGGTITGGYDDRCGGIVNIGLLTLENGSISYNNGSGVFNEGEFKFNGGTISNNTAEEGGGVYNSAIFEMSETAEISYNQAVYGAGVYNYIFRTFTMNNGTISHNEAELEGGGISNYGTFTMNSGVISNNIAGFHGGGLSSQSIFIMNDGTISYNESKEHGGGVSSLIDLYTNNPPKFTFNRGEISFNTANNGGGVYNEGVITMENGLISNNTASNRGGGVYQYGEIFPTLTMNGGEISDNIAAYGAAFYNYYKGALDLTGGTISNNSLTDGSDGGIFLSFNFKINFKNEEFNNDLIVELSSTLSEGSYILLTSNWNSSSTGKLILNDNDNGNLYTIVHEGQYYATFGSNIDIDQSITTSTYNGNEIPYIVTGTNSDFDFTIEYYYNNSWSTMVLVNAGTYDVRITREATLEYTEFSITISNGLVINKAASSIDTSNVLNNYTYNGSEQSVTSGANIIGGSNGVLVYSNNTFINFGTYTITITLLETENYLGDTTTVTINVEKATTTIDTSNVQLNYTYNGSEQSLLSGATAFGSENGITYTNNKFMNAGEYVVTISLAETENYYSTSTTVVITVAKATLDLSNITFNNKTVYFNFNTHTIELIGNLPEGVTVSYSGGNEGSVGKYIITATFTLSAELLLNYNVIEPMTATLTVSSLWLNLIVIILTILLVILIVNYIRIKNNNKENINNNVKTMSIAPLALLPLTSVAVPIQLYIIIGLTCGIVAVGAMCIFNKTKLNKNEEVLTINQEPITELKEETIVEEIEDIIEKKDRVSTVDSDDQEDEESEDSTDLVTARVNKETGKMILIRYKKSFSARLNLSEDINKDYYSILKNKLLSYEKIKSRISWNYESFNFGRMQTSKINVRGKSLFVYLPLKPEDYIDSKYNFIDCSHIKKYELLPLRIKVKSNRGLNHALELIEIVMEQLETKLLNNYEEVNYYQKNRGFDKLLSEGLIKEIIDEDTFKDLTEVNKEFLDSNKIVSIDLESVKNLKFSSEIITINKEKVQGKKDIINIDTLSSNFNDGDIINIDILKKKKLVPNNSKAIKCLARGTLDKKLTLDLQDYSTDAIKMIIITGGKVL